VALAKFDQVMSTCHERQSRSANAVVNERTVRNKARGRRLTAMIVQGCGLTSFHMPFDILFGFYFAGWFDCDSQAARCPGG
jgi:hypothetical protein